VRRSTRPVDAGATQVNGISFRVDDQAKVEAQARDAAMKDAKSKADALASAAGVNITGVASISEVSSPIPTPYPYAVSAGAPAQDRAVTPVEPGKVTLDVAATGTVIILGAQRPRRLSQYQENRGIPARDMNVEVTQLTAMLREAWDYFERVIAAPPGETMAPLPTGRDPFFQS